MKYVEEISKLIGLKIGERFSLHYKVMKDDSYKVTHELGSYKLTEKGIVDEKGCLDTYVIHDMLFNENIEMKPFPYKPSYGESYYYASLMEEEKEGVKIDWHVWDGDEIDLALFSVGNCFRTEEEAIKNSGDVIKKLKDFYKNY